MCSDESHDYALVPVLDCPDKRERDSIVERIQTLCKTAKEEEEETAAEDVTALLVRYNRYAYPPLLGGA